MKTLEDFLGLDLAHRPIQRLAHDLTAAVNDFNNSLVIPEASDPAPGDLRLLRCHETTGRPLGNDEFIRRLEEAAGRILRKGKLAPKPKTKTNY